MALAEVEAAVAAEAEAEAVASVAAPGVPVETWQARSIVMTFRQLQQTVRPRWPP